MYGRHFHFPFSAYVFNAIILSTIFVCSSMNPWEMSCFAPSNSPNRHIPGDTFGRGKHNGFVLTAPKFLNRPGQPFFAHYVLNCLFNLPSVAFCCSSNKFPVRYDSLRWTMYTYWKMTSLLRSTKYHRSLQLHRMKFNRIILIMWMMFCLCAAKACWKECYQWCGCWQRMIFYCLQFR